MTELNQWYKPSPTSHRTIIGSKVCTIYKRGPKLFDPQITGIIALKQVHSLKAAKKAIYDKITTITSDMLVSLAELKISR